ncbi:MAG: acyl-CoA dehydrogenase [Oleiphilaceae bacterium]|nr:acyl-CoA dehydrogenase [Oleiphilaceae bacterium]
MSEIDIEHLQQWVGKQLEMEDDISLFQARALAAALDRTALPEKGDALPPFWEWMYFLPTPSASETGPDGHPDKGGFLPPVPLPRRMWAAGEAEYLNALTIGEPAKRVSTIDSVELKEGRSGVLVFVNVRHDIYQHDTHCVSQVQNIVYREASESKEFALPPGKPAPSAAAFSDTITPDSVLLFRYSALTYNGHRIHYDRPYTTEVEGYPALVVHGPLLVTLLLELPHKHVPDRRLKQFSFRAIRPTFDSHDFSVAGVAEGDSLKLWSADIENCLCMSIDATLDSE